MLNADKVLESDALVTETNGKKILVDALGNFKRVPLRGTLSSILSTLALIEKVKNAKR